MNPNPLVSEAKALPTAPQPLPLKTFVTRETLVLKCFKNKSFFRSKRTNRAKAQRISKDDKTKKVSYLILHLFADKIKSKLTIIAHHGEYR